LRSTFDDGADWYLRALAAAKVCRHLHKVGAPKLTSLRHSYAVELSKLTPERQINAWIAVITSGSIDLGTVRMAVRKLVK
jgi:hypothetical protein